MEGTWTQGGRGLPLTLERTDEPFELSRPQTPEPPFPYASREVTFENEADGVTLAGTLLTPDGEGPFPAVLFVSGSGPQDRNETLMGHEPFLVIADHLARHGIASLRYDDRGVAASTGEHMGSTVTDFAEDAAAGVAFLAAQPKIDGDAVGILGHSEGGLAGPHAAALNDEIDYLVLLAPPGVPLTELLKRQGADQMRLQGMDDATVEMVTAAQVEDLALVADESVSDEALREELRKRTKARMETLGDAAEAMGLTEETAEQSIAQASTPWFRSLMRADPAVYLRQAEVPVLALFGGKDSQVAAEENAEALREARPDADIRILPGLNHLFQHAETGGIDEYSQIEETVAPEVLEAITEWIGERSGSAAGE
jgi:pimeloyl-ACP methyl ester carboxylesterase